MSSRSPLGIGESDLISKVTSLAGPISCTLLLWKYVDTVMWWPQLGGGCRTKVTRRWSLSVVCTEVVVDWLCGCICLQHAFVAAKCHCNMYCLSWSSTYCVVQLDTCLKLTFLGGWPVSSPSVSTALDQALRVIYIYDCRYSIGSM